VSIYPVQLREFCVKRRLEARSWLTVVGARSAAFVRFLDRKSSTSPEEGVAPREKEMLYTPFRWTWNLGKVPIVTRGLSEVEPSDQVVPT